VRSEGTSMRICAHSDTPYLHDGLKATAPVQSVRKFGGEFVRIDLGRGDEST
jgi:hypothetical protein